MNKLIFLCLCATALIATPYVIGIADIMMLQDNDDTEALADFIEFTNQFDKVYEHDTHMISRYEIFKSNRELIQEHNTNFLLGDISFALGINQFADMTNEEFRELFHSYSKKSESANDKCSASGIWRRMIGEDLPETVDWRTKGVVSRVKDQGQCGSCWSFSASGCMEGANALKTGELIELSEQMLVDCVNNGTDTCNAGGEMSDAFCFAISNHGDDAESSYPYEGTSGNMCKANQFKGIGQFTRYMNVFPGDEIALQSAIANHPTVSIAIDASSILFQFYRYGVYVDHDCKNGIDDLDHGVLLVGYGTEEGHDYFLVKNSWSTTWGDNGYIKMARNKDNQCGIASDASFILTN